MDRTLSPKFVIADQLDLIFPERIELKNGCVLYWMKDVKDEAVKLDIDWEAGTKYQDQKLISSFTNKLLLSGSEELSSKQIDEEMDFYGGFYQMQLDKDHAGITLYGLTENMNDIFSVFSKAFSVANFPQNELDKERTIAIEKFKIEQQKVKVICRQLFTPNLFGADTAYGQVAELSDFDALNSDELRRFFNTHYKTAPTLFLTGNVNKDFIEVLRDWSANFQTPIKTNLIQEFTQTNGRVHHEKVDAIQTAIRIGRLMFDKKHPDYFGFQLLNTIYGGYFGSRLMANIREDKGYTYGIGSGMAVMQDAGYFFIATEVGKDVKDDAVKEIFNEMNKLKEAPVSEEELTKVKNYMLGEFLRQADGPMALIEVFKNIYYNKLPKSYYADFIQAIHDATPQSLQDLANKYFVEEEMLVVTAG
ncbi:insulinase family protein [Paracrocinitomix mangrovi]|uniref:M16 family metallopeptidase n=1 Tax=Paracrocinitomix mangrovi TaxID=2862509 RepID=UPI001C8E9335|nr:pitrilysin family protein [Paracrocinitomix mangrovi]UKN01579.1 insulinase family protein [Paracrocinitomix mangrovi]